VDPLLQFIVSAKRACYVGSGAAVEPSRLGSRDLAYQDGDYAYRDSYFGNVDFLGQETVWFKGNPVWAMNYYGYIIRTDLIDASRTGATIKAALTAMYAENRFLGGFAWTGPHGTYADGSTGDHQHFHGHEYITVDGVKAYALDYFGGVIKAV
jgi:Domain of unknown function (DUF5680)